MVEALPPCNPYHSALATVFFKNPGKKPETVADAKPPCMQSPAAHAQLLRCARPKTVVMLESESMSAAKLSQKRTVGRTSRVSLVKHGTMARSHASWKKKNRKNVRDSNPRPCASQPIDYAFRPPVELLPAAFRELLKHRRRSNFWDFWR